MEFNKKSYLPLFELFVRSKCSSSKKMIIKMKESENFHDKFQYKIIDIEKDHMPDYYKIPVITPAFWVDGVLLKYGNFDFNGWLENYLKN